MSAPLIWRAGGCHCGAVRFEVALPEVVEATTCNCSMCQKIGFIHVIVPESRFRLTQGAEAITTYTFNTGVAKHRFCKVCGIKVFYVPRSHPDGIDVNVRCLDPATIESVSITQFDDTNREAETAAIAHLAEEDQNR